MMGLVLARIMTWKLIIVKQSPGAMTGSFKWGGGPTVSAENLRLQHQGLIQSEKQRPKKNMSVRISVEQFLKFRTGSSSSVFCVVFFPGLLLVGQQEQGRQC